MGRNAKYATSEDTDRIFKTKRDFLKAVKKIVTAGWSKFYKDEKDRDLLKKTIEEKLDESSLWWDTREESKGRKEGATH